MRFCRKFGQLFLLGFQGACLLPAHPIVRDIRERNLGGVLLFDKLLAKNKEENNIINGAQVRRLTSALQEYAGGNLLIATDQEGGSVCRLSPKRGFPASPPPADLGSTTLQRTRHYSAQTANLLKSLGINLNLAPVADINTHPENPVIGMLGRSFSSDPEKVSLHVGAWIEAHRERNILSCLKHFPGHGSSRQDSHLGFTDITRTWNHAELQPYKDIIEKDGVDAIMTGHLFNSRLDPDFPATLSRNILTLLLRGELGFRGIVISDDMQMKALSDSWGFEEAICRAFAAGVDMIIIANNLRHDENILAKALQAIQRGIEKKMLTEEMLEEACRRVQRLKASLPQIS